MSVDDRMLRAALAYTERFDFAVLPCKPRGKEPLTEHGCKDTTRDLATIRAWWERWPYANVGASRPEHRGLSCSTWTLGTAAIETLATLEQEHGKLPETPTVLTGGGGLHYYFKNPGSVVPTTAGRVGRGIDVRGDGGYVIAPKSIHASGNRYLWEVLSRIDEVPLAEIPPWLLKLMTARIGPDNETSRDDRLDLARLAAGVSEGERDRQLFSIGVLFTPARIYARASSARRAGCGCPLPAAVPPP